MPNIIPFPSRKLTQAHLATLRRWSAHALSTSHLFVEPDPVTGALVTATDEGAEFAVIKHRWIEEMDCIVGPVRGGWEVTWNGTQTETFSSLHDALGSICAWPTARPAKRTGSSAQRHA
jgi:hypothetical protein